MQPRGFKKTNNDYAREIITTLPGLVAISDQMNPRDMSGEARELWQAACGKLGEANKLFAQMFNALEGPLEVRLPAASDDSDDPGGRQDVAGSGSAVRAWAREQGYEINDRGRIPREIVAAYEQAH